jgi:type II secretory pathway pseudopilin PulG
MRTIFGEFRMMPSNGTKGDPVNMKKLSLRKKRKGFTLVEALISILILTIVLFSIAALIVNVLALQMTLKDKENAYLAATLKTREMESLVIDDIVASSDEISIDNKEFEITLVVDEEKVVQGETVGKTVTFNVSWHGVNGGKNMQIQRTFSSKSSETRRNRLGYQHEEGKPGYGYGDTGHGHTGPPGQDGN